MSYWKSHIGIWGTLVLLAVGLMLSRFEERNRALAASAESEAHRLVGLDYAQSRLWYDFLGLRGKALSDHRLPSPALEEYRRYLAAFGLLEPGDAVTIHVAPQGGATTGVDQIRVALDVEKELVALHVTTEKAGRFAPAGTIRIRVVTGDSLTCEVAHLPEPVLWTIWPITAQPLFP
jgi:hypothetical protein